MIMNVRATASILVITAVGTACKQGPLDPSPAVTSERSSFSQVAAEDSVAWHDNELHFTDSDGSAILFVRDRADANKVEFYRNGLLRGTVHLVWQGEQVGSLTYIDAATSSWASTTASSSPELTASGTIGGGSCDPSDPEIPCVEFARADVRVLELGVVEGEIVVLSDIPCQGEISATIGASATMFVGAVATGLLFKSGSIKFALDAARFTYATAATAFGAAIALHACIQMAT